MTDKLMTFYVFALPEGEVHYFTTLSKLERFKKKRAVDGTHAEVKIPVSCAKDLVKLSKKKPKEKCPECGK